MLNCLVAAITAGVRLAFAGQIFKTQFNKTIQKGL